MSDLIHRRYFLGSRPFDLLINPDRDYQPAGNDRYARWRQEPQQPEP